MLNLHSGGELVSYDALRQVVPPEPTKTHVPIAHHRVVDLVKGTLAMFGHEVVDEHHALDHQGMRYFGLLTLRSPYTGYTDTVGLRNSNDRALPVGIGFGSRVFVCSNLSFVADHVIKRRHTQNLKRDLPGLMGELIEPLAIQREKQRQTFDRYRHTMLTSMHADHAIMAMYRMNVINVQRIADVVREWDTPTFEEFNEDRSVYRLFNAVTYALTGRVMENPRATPRLHAILDTVCEEIN